MMGDKINSEKNEQVNYRGLFVIIGFHEPHSTHSSIIDVMKFACLVFRFVLFNFVMLFTCRLAGLGAHDDTLIEETTKEPNDLTLKCSLDCICYIKVQLQHILDRTPLVFKSFSTFFSSIIYHGSSSSIKCHVYHHVGGRRDTPVVCNESWDPHTSHYTSSKKKQTTHTN